MQEYLSQLQSDRYSNQLNQYNGLLRGGYSGASGVARVINPEKPHDMFLRLCKDFTNNTHTRRLEIIKTLSSLI